MKPVIAWMKSNAAIVALTAVIIVAIPAAYIGSSMWNKRIRTSREAEASKALLDLNGLKVTYVLPSALPGGENVNFPIDGPNPRATAYFREHREKLDEQVARIVEVAQEVNSSGHRPLVAGVFPTPENRLKTLELAEALVGKDGRPSAYEELLSRINAGKPADPVQMEMAIQEHRGRKIEQLEQKDGRRQMTAEEAADLAKELTSIRLGFYQQHAQQLSLYAGLGILPRDVPTSVGAPPTVEESFLWQFDYWTIADLLRAVDRANTVEDERASVDEAVVKRIESITLEPLLPTRSQAEADPNAMQTQARRNPITGRSGGTESLYDIRNAGMTLVVSSARLQDLINAISRTNFMTVIDLQLEDVDVWSDLEQGYYYGPEHVVRAKLRIETVWLRNWTTPLMPPRVRKMLTGSDGTEQGGNDGGAG